MIDLILTPMGYLISMVSFMVLCHIVSMIYYINIDGDIFGRITRKYKRFTWVEKKHCTVCGSLRDFKFARKYDENTGKLYSTQTLYEKCCLNELQDS